MIGLDQIRQLVVSQQILVAQLMKSTLQSSAQHTKEDNLLLQIPLEVEPSGNMHAERANQTHAISIPPESFVKPL